MTLFSFLAHGALGAYDEIIFMGISAIFLVLMGISWFTSRNALPEEPLPLADPQRIDNRVDAPGDSPATAGDSPERFRLE